MSESILSSDPSGAPRAPAGNAAPWSLQWTDIAAAAVVCLAASTQLLFQRDLYLSWPAADIAAAWLRQLRDLLLVAVAIFTALAAVRGLWPRHPFARALLFAAALFAGALAGETAAYWLAWNDLPVYDLGRISVRAARWVLVGFAIAAFVLFQQRAASIAARAHDSEVRRLRLERQALELHLQVMKSQIEPHFLFNTLATVRRLQESDPARGREALASFIRYLRAAVPELRSHETTLGREVDLVRAYLAVLRSRMEDQLQVAIDVPDALRELSLPPLSLATLVENAIKHGVSRMPEGGALNINARIDGDALVLEVSDTGPGFTAAEGGGTGLANLRARLLALHGERAALSLAPNAPHGLVATLRIPATTPEREHR